jgi:hypothetical protein
MPNIPTPHKWRRALKSVKTITINLLQEPTDHKSSILSNILEVPGVFLIFIQFSYHFLEKP